MKTNIMQFSISNRQTPVRRVLALASAISTCFIPFSIAHAQEDKSLPSVVVTASRFPSDPAQTPIGATVITAEEIRVAGINNVNQAVRKIGGVYGRLNLSGTQDFELDLRGFGTNSNQNVVVLVDGVRLSENELTTALLSSIPIDIVERIEIVRGGNSVLYGEGATGGVIHVITKRGAPAGTHGSVTVEAGQFNHSDLRAFVTKGWDGFSISANASRMKSDNYRNNNAVDQENYGTGMQWASNDIRVGLRFDAARQDSRLPGPLTMAQFKADPRQTLTPRDFASIDTDRYIAFVERKLGAWEVAAELSHRDKNDKAYYDEFTYSRLANSKQTQFSPRLRHTHAAGGFANELVAGVDFIEWDLKNINTFSRSDVAQKSKAVYIRDEVKYDQLRIGAGLRHETFNKKSESNYDVSQSVNAWELQGSYAVTPSMTLFAKSGLSYRIPNADENASTFPASLPLKPQKSHDLELGGSIGNKAHKVTARLFQHRLNNEIFYHPNVVPGGANVNLDPTRRQGVEVEASTRLAPAWLLTAQWQHVKAEFTDGPNDGREMVMVPKNIVTTRLNWLPAKGHNASMGVQWVDEQRYGSDFTNTCSVRIPSYAVLDARYAYRLREWEFAVTGENLTDKDYFNNAFSCNSTSRSIYPNPGRQLKFSARYDF